MYSCVSFMFLLLFYSVCFFFFFFFKQKTAYEMRISDWSSDVCSSDLLGRGCRLHEGRRQAGPADPAISCLWCARQRSHHPAQRHPVLRARAGRRALTRFCRPCLRCGHDPAAISAKTPVVMPPSQERPAMLLSRRALAAFVLEIGRAHVRTPVTNAHHVCR